jgi:hypothetical protein
MGPLGCSRVAHLAHPQSLGIDGFIDGFDPGLL